MLRVIQSTVIQTLYICLPSAGSLVGHPAGYPDPLCSDGLHRLLLRPQTGHQWLGVTSDFWSLTPSGNTSWWRTNITRFHLSGSQGHIDEIPKQWETSRWPVKTLTPAQRCVATWYLCISICMCSFFHSCVTWQALRVPCDVRVVGNTAAANCQPANTSLKASYTYSDLKAPVTAKTDGTLPCFALQRASFLCLDLSANFSFHVHTAVRHRETLSTSIQTVRVSEIRSGIRQTYWRNLWPLLLFVILGTRRICTLRYLLWQICDF